jgi:hypothetical protein
LRGGWPLSIWAAPGGAAAGAGRSRPRRCRPQGSAANQGERRGQVGPWHGAVSGRWHRTLSAQGLQGQLDAFADPHVGRQGLERHRVSRSV